MSQWQSKTIGELCDAGNGKVKTGPFGSQLHQSDYSEEGIPVVMPTDIKNGSICEEKIARVSENHVIRLAKHKFSKGDIVYGRRGDIGRQALIRDTNIGWLCGTGCLRITLDESDVIPEYLHLYLKMPEVVSWIQNQAIGATMPNLNTEILRRVPVIYPNIKNIQKKIVSLIFSYDDLIENNQRRITLLEKMAEEIYREWFVRFRFPGYQSAKFEKGIPKGWTFKKIVKIDVFKVVPRNLKLFDGIKNYYATSEVDGINLLNPTEEITFNSKPSRAQYVPEIYSVWFARMKNTFKVLGIGEANKNLIENSVLSSGFVGFKTEQVFFPFLYLTIKSQGFHDQKDLFTTGATQESLTNDGLDRIEILFSNEELIKKFGLITLPMIEQILQLQNVNKQASEIRDSLLPRLISGKLSVENLDIQFPPSMCKEILNLEEEKCS